MKINTIHLGDVALVINGKTPSKAEQRTLGYPVFKIKDVDENGHFSGQITSFVEERLAMKLQEKLICLGDTLILNAAHNADYVGSKSYFAKGSAVGALATGEWLIIRPDINKADARFLYYWSLSTSVTNRITELIKGIHLYPKDVAAIPILLPNITEQQRISWILEKADKLRSMRQYAGELNDAFLKAAFNELFANDLAKSTPVTLQDVLLQPLSNGYFAKNSEYGSGVPIIWVDDLYNSITIKFDNLRHTLASADQQNQYAVIEDDLLFTRSSLVRTGIGHVNIVSGLREKTLYECHIIRARVDRKKVNPFYLLGLYRSQFGKANILQKANTATMTTISQDALEDLLCPLPPMDKQNRFELIVRQSQHLQHTYQESLRQADHLFKSLLHQAFSVN